MTCACAMADRLLAALRAAESGDVPDLAAEAREQAMWENELARRVHSDPGSFLPLYEHYYDRIYGFLYRRTMDADEAQDLTSRVFLQAYESLCRREQRVALRPWLYSIAANLHVSHVRRLCRWAARVRDAAWLHLRPPPASPREQSEQRQQRCRVRAALARLPRGYRTVLMLRYDEELPTDEIAASLGLTPAGVRTRIARGLAMLEKSLGPEPSARQEARDDAD